MWIENHQYFGPRTRKYARLAQQEIRPFVAQARAIPFEQVYVEMTEDALSDRIESLREAMREAFVDGRRTVLFPMAKTVALLGRPDIPYQFAKQYAAKGMKLASSALLKISAQFGFAPAHVDRVELARRKGEKVKAHRNLVRAGVQGDVPSLFKAARMAQLGLLNLSSHKAPSRNPKLALALYGALLNMPVDNPNVREKDETYAVNRIILLAETDVLKTSRNSAHGQLVEKAYRHQFWREMCGDGPVC